MKKKVAKRVLLAVFSFFFVGCSSTKWISQEANQELAINGDQNDWHTLEYNEKHNFSYGISNDSDFVNLCLVIPNRDMQRQVMMQGLEIWFEGDHGAHSLGLHYPLGAMVQKGKPSEHQQNVEEDHPDFMKLNHLNEMDVYLGKEDMGDRMLIEEALNEGISVHCNLVQEIFVYECQIPLTKKISSYGLFDSVPKSMGLIVEIPQPDFNDIKPRMKPGMGGGQRGGGMGGGPPGGMRQGGGMEGRGPGSGPGPGMQRQEQFHFEVEVQLAQL